MTAGIKIIDALLCAAQDGRCFYCNGLFCGQSGTRMKTRKVGRWTRDHLRARSNGHGLGGNTVLACAPCNMNKGAREPTDDELTRASMIFGIVNRLGVALIGPRWEWDQRQ